MPRDSDGGGASQGARPGSQEIGVPFKKTRMARSGFEVVHREECRQEESHRREQEKSTASGSEKEAEWPEEPRYENSDRQEAGCHEGHAEHEGGCRGQGQAERREAAKNEEVDFAGEACGHVCRCT